MSSKEPLSLDTLKKTPEYSRLSNRHRALIDAFVEHRDKFAAYKSVYRACNDKSACAGANKVFSMPAIRAVLDVYFQTPSDPLAAVKAVILRASRNKKLTTAQSQMIRLYAAANGISVDSPMEPAAAPAAPAPQGKVVLDKIVERDGRRLHSVITDIGAVEIS